MSACEAELCPVWAGDGCVCSVVGITDEERRKQQAALGINVAETDAWDECAVCGHDRDEHDGAVCSGTIAGLECDCLGFVDEDEVRA